MNLKLQLGTKVELMWRMSANDCMKVTNDILSRSLPNHKKFQVMKPSTNEWITSTKSSRLNQPKRASSEAESTPTKMNRVKKRDALGFGAVVIDDMLCQIYYDNYELLKSSRRGSRRIKLFPWSTI